MNRRLTALGLLCAAQLQAGQPPRNIIVFVADGCGANTHQSFEFWRGEPALYRGEAWIERSATTHALRSGPRPGSADPLAQDPRFVYDPATAWSTAGAEGESGGYPYFFEGYRWLRATAPDSANTASALFTGVPTYKGAINVDGAGNPTRSMAEGARDRGMAVGIVTSVPLSHATPAAAGGAHVPAREMYTEIAHQMLTEGACTVIAGAGHPEYDDNAIKRTEASYSFVSEDDWRALRAGSLKSADGAAWTLVEDASRMASLATGDVPIPLIMVPRVGQTLQQQRAPRDEAKTAAPWTHALNRDMPTLRDMALAALNGVDDDPDGFFLMIEGGAVDWAMHDNQLGRVIEEMSDYHDTIAAVCAILDSGDRGYDWSNTLVVITADHDHLLFGPNSDKVPFEPLADNGPGAMPGYRWHSNSHSNQPVPVFARGPGSERIAQIPTTPDEWTARDGTTYARPPAFHQSALGRTMLEMLDTAERP